MHSTKREKKNEAFTISGKIRKLAGKAIYSYDMITPGDKIAVGVSGGKDSLLLLHLLKYMQVYSPVKYELHACCVDMTAGGWDTQPLESLCASLSVPLHIVPYAIEKIIDERQERSPCSFCANMRRGILNTVTKRIGCNKLALGHNLDDSVETTLMNLLRNGRFRCYQPKLWHDRAEIWVIRPLIYLTEYQIQHEINRLGIKTSQYCCKYGADTERSRTKSIIETLKGSFPSIKTSVIHALENHQTDDCWQRTPQRYFRMYGTEESPSGETNAPYTLAKTPETDE
ncbi:MAG: ATP-binding protein [Pyramidobacter sp.]|nr:ATP-binding protein [Pyramidobacter sp.]